MRLTGVAVGFAQQMLRLAEIARPRGVQRFKAEAALLPRVDDDFHYRFFQCNHSLLLFIVERE
ncbi:hypothetical protein ACSGN1_003000 [Cronobacter sakazakii]